MKNTAIIPAVLFFFFSFTVNAQNVGDRKLQKDVFGDQPVWKQLTASDTYQKMTVSDYFSCKTGVALFWNGVDHNMAEVESFNPEDTILVVSHNNADYIYKIGCTNRLKYIKCISPEKETTPTPTKKLGKREEEPVKTTVEEVKKLTFQITYKNGDAESTYQFFNKKTCELIRTEVVYEEMIHGVLTPVDFEEWQRWTCCHKQSDILGLPYRNSGCPHN